MSSEFYDSVIIVVASVSTAVFAVGIIILLLLLYRTDPLCCKFRTGLCWEEPQQNPPGQLFITGPPDSYHLNIPPQPHLPSYESVRKKDREQQIHAMPTNQFDQRPHVQTESPPPSYEESVRCSDGISIDSPPTFLPHPGDFSTTERPAAAARDALLSHRL